VYSMLPEFNQDGNLPSGVHRATIDEIVARFVVPSARRKWLGQRLHDLLDVARATGKLERVFLWGSFVTDKESPNDLDVLLVMAADFELDRVPEGQRILFDHTQARIHFNADEFWTKASLGQVVLDLWLDTYQTGKDFKRKGIVEVTSI
jgi:GNAT superfamily N-acetyltransferase